VPIKGLRICLAAEKKGQSGHGRREGEGRSGEEWRDKGRDKEEIEKVDFVASCKNSFGRP